MEPESTAVRRTLMRASLEVVPSEVIFKVTFVRGPTTPVNVADLITNLNVNIKVTRYSACISIVLYRYPLDLRVLLYYYYYIIQPQRAILVCPPVPP